MLVFITQHIVANLTGFFPHVMAGAASVWDHVVYPLALNKDPPMHISHLCLAALQIICYTPCVILGEHSGVNKRKRELTEFNTSD